MLFGSPQRNYIHTQQRSRPAHQGRCFQRIQSQGSAGHRQAGRGGRDEHAVDGKVGGSRAEQALGGVRRRRQDVPGVPRRVVRRQEQVLGVAAGAQHVAIRVVVAYGRFWQEGKRRGRREGQCDVGKTVQAAKPGRSCRGSLEVLDLQRGGMRHRSASRIRRRMDRSSKNPPVSSTGRVYVPHEFEGGVSPLA